MIPDQEEIAAGLRGAWRLARFDAGGLEEMALSFEGLIRSFFAAVIVLPGYVVLVIYERLTMGLSIDPVALLTTDGLVYLLQWASFPLIAMVLAKLLGLGPHFVTYVVAANWAAVLQIMLILGALLISVLLPPLGALAFLFATILLLVYDWIIVRLAFRAAPMLAVGIVLLNVLAGGLIKAGIDRGEPPPDSPRPSGTAPPPAP